LAQLARVVDKRSLKWLVFNDPHIAARPPTQKRKDDYEDVVFDKLAQICVLSVEHGVDAVVCTGDWFHKKRPTQVPYRLVKRLIRWIKLVNLPMLTVVGNHDVQYYNTSRRGLKNQPLGSVWEACDNLLILGDAEGGQRGQGYFELTGTNNDRVIFAGSNFIKPVDGLEGPEEDKSQFDIRNSDGIIGWEHRADPPYLKYVQLIHASIYVKSPPFRPFTLLKDLADLTIADLVHCGHIHDDIGIFSERRSGGRPDLLFTNVGSLTRGSLSEDNIQRIPTILLVKYFEGTFEIERIPLDHKPAEEIFDVEQYRAEKKQVRHFESWLEELKAEIELTEEDLDVSRAINESGLNADAKAIAQRILLSVNT